MNTGKAKRDGVVYTPAHVVERILDEVLPQRPDDMRRMVLCDPSCGDGAFLVAVARRILEVLPWRQAKPALANLTGYDIDRQALAACRDRLDEVLATCCPGKSINWQVKHRDAITSRLTPGDLGKYTLVVGNPPYVRVQHLERKRRDLIARNWPGLNGSTDLYLVFYLLGLQLLEDDGLLGYITPSSWMRSHSGAGLREILTTRHGIRKIIDFAEHQVFDKVTTYTSITIIDKNRRSNPIPVLRLGQHGRYRKCTALTLADKPGGPWFIAARDEAARIRRLVSRGPRLGDIANINIGIQTLADEVFVLPASTDNEAGDKDRLVLDSKHGPVEIEKSMLRRIVKASRMSDGLDVKTRFLVYPYDENGNLYSLKELSDRAPLACRWLRHNKQRLLARDKGEFDKSRWHAFGRSVSITSGFGEKIITSGMNARPNFQLCKQPEATFYSGYSVKPKPGVRVSLDDLLATLNSADMEFYIRLTSRPYQNRWYSYAKSFIQDFPVPEEMLG